MVEPSVLFVCTGNYYRSRFAEALFTHLAECRRLRWQADSRGLWEGPNVNEGPISMLARQALESRGVPFDSDLESSSVVVVLDEGEHRPMIQRRFPEWVDRVRYWGVHDLPLCPPDEALVAIEWQVGCLIDELAEFPTMI